MCCLEGQIASVVGASHSDFHVVEPSLLHSLDYLGIGVDLFQSILKKCLQGVSVISVCDFGSS
ncbi:MAG: hypothetical protein ACYCRD_10995 [Leptospirillum sp.]